MTPDALLDATLEKARKIPVGGRADAAAVARAAIESARLEARVRRARRGRFAMGAAAAAAVLALGWGGWALMGEPNAAVHPVAVKAGPAVPEAPEPPSPAPAPRLRLASGDLLIGAAGVEFEVVSESRDRVVRLSEGEMLFDIAHRPTGSFIVRANDWSVRVLGTVFSVRREGDVIGVRVFDGVVVVWSADGAELERLSAGNEWTSGPLDGLDEWRARSEREWQEIAPGGARADGRAAPGAGERVGVEGRPSVVGAEPADSSSGVGEPLDLARAQALLARGEFEAALRMSEEHGAAEGAWLLLRADALRGLGRDEAAARTYESAARSLDGNQRVGAVFAAAQLRSRVDPDAALRLLNRSGVTTRSSPLEERARALRIELLYRVGRSEEADAEALVYEERFSSRR